MNRTGLTRIVGFGGVLGVRLVRKGGFILWLRDKYQSDRLIPYVGHEVLVEDDIEKLLVSESGFDVRNKLLHGKWITTIFIR